jgi:ankyrin repeat protein
LLEAIGEIFPEFAMTLIQRGADIDFPTTDFMTPLHLALQEQMFDVAEELVRRGANVKTQTIEGFTAMHFATAAGSEKWVDKYEIKFLRGLYL